MSIIKSFYILDFAAARRLFSDYQNVISCATNLSDMDGKS